MWLYRCIFLHIMEIRHVSTVKKKNSVHVFSFTQQLKNTRSFQVHLELYRPYSISVGRCRSFSKPFYPQLDPSGYGRRPCRTWEVVLVNRGHSPSYATCEAMTIKKMKPCHFSSFCVKIKVSLLLSGQSIQSIAPKCTHTAWRRDGLRQHLLN